MQFRGIASVVVICIFTVTVQSPSQALAQDRSSVSLRDQAFKLSLPFSEALEILQNKQLNYTFRDVDLLRLALTHSSFSKENNGALNILGASLIETSVSLRSLNFDIDMSPKELNRRISEISKVETSCAVDGMRMGLEKLLRVSPKTDPSTPSVVCGAFRAIFAAIALDTNNSGVAEDVFWRVHSKNTGRALVL